MTPSPLASHATLSPIVAQLASGVSMTWVIAAVLVLGVVAIVLLLMIVRGATNAARRRRTETLTNALGDFEAIPDANKALRKRYADLPGLSRAGGRIRAAYRAELDGRALTIFHHNLTTAAGNTPIVIDHTVYACEAPAWPTMTIRPRHGLVRLAFRFLRPRGLLLDDPQFNRVYRVAAEDDAFAVTFLSPEMQRFLLAKPTLRWRVGRAEVCMIYRGPLKPARVGASLDRLRRFWSLVPPELEAWEA